MLVVDVEKRLGEFALTAKFEAADGATALFGSSGSGKTSIVNMIAGLIAPDRGRIALDGTVLFDSATRTNVPAHRRRVGYVFQEGRLFPHLTVCAESRLRPLDERRRGRPRRARAHRRAARHRPSAVAAAGKAVRRRAQRVAFGRALLMQPRLLLLDEPLASLDRARKLEILPYLARLRDEAKVPMIYVSHQAGEITRLASQVVRIEDGRCWRRAGWSCWTRSSAH